MIPASNQQEITLYRTKPGITLLWVAAHIGAAIFAATAAFLLDNAGWLMLLFFTLPLAGIGQEAVLHRYLANLDTAKWTLLTIMGSLCGILLGFLVASTITLSVSISVDDATRAEQT